MKPLDMALYKTVEILKKIQSNYHSQEKAFGEYFPSNILCDFKQQIQQVTQKLENAEYNHVVKDYKSQQSMEPNSFEKLKDEEKALLFHYANDSLFHAQYVVVKKNKQFEFMQKAVNILDKEKEILPQIIQDVSPLKQHLKDTYLTKNNSSFFTIKIPEAINDVIVLLDNEVDNQVFDNVCFFNNLRQQSLNAGLALTAIKEAETELTTSNGTAEKAVEFVTNAYALFKYGLSYPQGCSFDSKGMRIKDEIVYKYAMGM